MKKIKLSIVAVLFAATMFSQENELLSREFWSTQPIVSQVKAKIKAGNNPVEMSERNFDVLATAILAGAPIESIEYLLSLPETNINTKTHEGRTYLIWAAVKQNVEVVKLLLEKGAAVNILDTHGINAINMGANGGIEDKEFYDALIAKGENIKQTNNSGATAILLILQKLKDPSMIEYFESKGLNIHSKDNDGNGAFNYAAKGGNIKMMNVLIKKGLIQKGVNKKGETAVLIASKGARRATPELATFKYLASKGFKLNVENKDGQTPLTILASKTKDVELIQFLLDAKNDANKVDNSGNNALINAAEKNSKDVVELLASNTIDINTKNSLGETALSNAVQGNTLEVVSYLLNHGASVNVQDKDGYSLLHYWAKSGKQRNAPSKPNQDILTLLVSKGLNAKGSQPNGNTLLHEAVQENNIHLIKQSLTLGVDINAKNNEGNTALLLAALNAKNTEVLNLLIANGADKKTTSSFGETAFDLASENEILSKSKIDINFLK
ncbi:ankyrin repeat domain-containing protein [Wenyingzhuangia sp. IMCC45467]